METEARDSRRLLDSGDIEFLGTLSMFAGLRAEVLARIAERAERIDVVEDGLLFREGEPAKEMAVVLSGKLEVRKRAHNGVDACIATLGPGDVVGEMSLFDIQPRSADVWAYAPVSMMLLRHGALGELYRHDPQSYTLLVLNIAREISIRLRRLDEAMANIMGHIRSVANVTYTPLERATAHGERDRDET
jgi:CRP/FNR family transcriptional regulator, cyclic AMP receptor protein